MSGMLLDGERTSGQDVRTQNVTAAMAIANIVKTSLGPVGLDKMLVDEIGDVTITNDGATILAQLDIEHPAARVLVELAQLQDQEVGDGTTSVVIIAAELLKRANELVKNNIHPTVVMSGYRFACKEAVKYIKSNLIVTADGLGRENLINAGMTPLLLSHYDILSPLTFWSIARTSMSSKILGSESDFFSSLAVTAALQVKTEKDGKSKCPISNIHILKSHGQSLLDSALVEGFALNCTRAAQGMPTYVNNAKIALLDFNLQKHKMQMGVQIVVTDTKQV
jgi:T-complex protein 1 subunit alpha